MIETLTIEGFRGVLRRSEIPLGPLTILVGPNNSGKSTCLEALALGCVGSEIDAALDLIVRRGGRWHDALAAALTKASADSGPSSVISLVTAGWSATATVRRDAGLDPRVVELARDAELDKDWQQFALSSDTRGPGTARAQGTVRVGLDGARRRTDVIRRGTVPRPHPSAFVDVELARATDSLENAYSELERAGRTADVVAALAHSAPGLTDLRILESNGHYVLHLIRKGVPPVPVFVAGDGMKRLLVIAAALVRAAGGVVALEEPESFQHPRYLRELVTMLAATVAAGTQVVLSTHSLELIDQLVDAAQGARVDLRLLKLRLVDGELRHTAIPLQDVARLRHELFEDVRE